MHRHQKFKFQEEDKLRVDPKNPVHYTLSWIAYVDNNYEIYKMLKVKNSRFLKRMDWKGEKKYQNIKFMYSQYLILKQILRELTIEFGRFLIKIYFRG